MRRKAMKAAALGMAAVMTVGMFAGCGSGSDSGKGDSGSSVELNDAGTYPIVKDGTLDMTIFTMSMPNVEDFATNDFTKFMEEKTGIHMDFVTGGRDDWEEKLNMLLQSDDYPDIIMGVSPNIAKYGVKEASCIIQI